MPSWRGAVDRRRMGGRRGSAKVPIPTSSPHPDRKAGRLGASGLIEETLPVCCELGECSSPEGWCSDISWIVARSNFPVPGYAPAGAHRG